MLVYCWSLKRVFNHVEKIYTDFIFMKPQLFIKNECETWKRKETFVRSVKRNENDQDFNEIALSVQLFMDCY